MYYIWQAKNGKLSLQNAPNNFMGIAPTKLLG